MCLIPQSGTDAQGRRRNQPAIYGTVAIYSEIDPEWLCALVNSDLAEDGVTIRPKRVQEHLTEQPVGLVCVHQSCCLQGIKSTIVYVLTWWRPR